MSIYYKILIVSGPRAGSTWLEEQCIHYNYDKFITCNGEYFSNKNHTIEDYYDNNKKYINYTLRMRPHQILNFINLGQQTKILNLIKVHNYRIALRRKNTWDQLCSFFIQENYNGWYIHDTIKNSNKKLILSPMEIRKINRMIEIDNEFLDSYSDHWTHNVYYEDLVDNRQQVLNKIFINKHKQSAKSQIDKKVLIQNYNDAYEYWCRLKK